MENYKQASEEAQKIIFEYLKSIMKERKITQKKLAQIVNVSEVTLLRQFKGTSPMTLDVYLQILGALKLRPYIIPSEDDQQEMKRIYFN